MFLRNLMNRSTETYSDKLRQLKDILNDADAVVIGAGSGLSTAAGFTYSGERFERYFHDLRKNIISGIFIPAAFILFRRLKNIGHGGAAIFG